MVDVGLTGVGVHQIDGILEVSDLPRGHADASVGDPSKVIAVALKSNLKGRDLSRLADLDELDAGVLTIACHYTEFFFHFRHICVGNVGSTGCPAKLIPIFITPVN